MSILKDDLVHTSPMYIQENEIKGGREAGRPIWGRRRLWSALLLFYFQKRINTV